MDWWIMVVAARRSLLAVFSCLAVVFTVCVYLDSVPLSETRAREIQGQSEGDRTSGQKGRKLEENVASRVVGETQCLDCHRSEYARWKKSKHAAGAFDTLRTDKDARKYAEALGIKVADITAPNSLCVQCHATRQTLASGEARVLPAVSCEACHSASGGAAGWLNAHAVYGEQGSLRVAETEMHYLERKA
ncbi:MAG: cytochrome c family protein, partial [Pirellulales bacterium]|nr:cytochrome c family protein [Pirellulales bacterium]